MQRVKQVAIWILQILLAIVMVGPGLQKFTSPMWERMFRTWGYPDHFYLLIGAIEVVGGVALLIPRFASASAVVLSAVMIGAAVTQQMHGRSPVGELVFALLLALIAYVRWPAWRVMLQKRA